MCFENFGKFIGKNLQWCSFSVNWRPTNYSLQSCVFLKFIKFMRTSTVAFFFVESGANRFTAE